MSLPDLSHWRVLVVDDEPDSIEIVRMVLSAADATVYTAANGIQAFEVFKREMPSLVLTDLSMPERDGWQLLQDIRSYENGHQTPVVALTAHAMAGDRERVADAGFDGYLSKPLHMITLLTDLKACLEINGKPPNTDKEKAT
jgi:CheY-like chemotaxis protein